MSQRNKITCFQCKKSIEFTTKISFREECPHCSADMHTCLNCRFYSTSAYNECLEPSAEKVKDKDRNNYCEYFSFTKKTLTTLEETMSEKEKHLKAAEAVFKKT